ncbi:MAG: glycosyltransferase family 2 protein [Planctomycetaceae bacterium]|jgi:glycosyltransferase involved in cell wall biosynthesis|nr:glycosyltransferase family 2 protein [Planctomycetaceae bacterium]
MPTLSILIPVYNEMDLLERVVEGVVGGELPDGFGKEIIIVDDASTDASPEIIKQLCKKYHNIIKPLTQPKNKGKGAAIRLAINAANGDYIVFQDADLEYNPNDYCDLLKPLIENKADAVYGSRFCKSESKKVKFVCHKFGNILLTFLVNLLTGLKLTDMETCYKTFHSNTIKSIPLKSNKFDIEAEITIKIAKRKLHIHEVPVNYNGRNYASGKKITWKDGISTLIAIFKYKFFDNDE